MVSCMEELELVLVHKLVVVEHMLELERMLVAVVEVLSMGLELQKARNRSTNFGRI